MDNFQEKSENSLLDLSFENIGSALATESTVDNKFGMEENSADLLFSSTAEPEAKSKDGDVFDECMPMTQSTYSNEGLLDKDEPFSVVEPVPAPSQNLTFELNNAELKDEVESDYMNPYANVRTQKEEKPSLFFDESAAAPFSDVQPELQTEPEKNIAPPESDVSHTSDKVNAAKVEVEASSTECIKIEQMFKDYGLDTWFNPARLHPKGKSFLNPCNILDTSRHAKKTSFMLQSVCVCAGVCV
uniref:Uncharacterized protein n=1 Tax=Anopheles culicifacies TaxID=139723 RepID=A0A182MWY3_9DIPT